jgi:hypothetical protein
VLEAGNSALACAVGAAVALTAGLAQLGHVVMRPLLPLLLSLLLLLLQVFPAQLLLTAMAMPSPTTGHTCKCGRCSRLAVDSLSIRP